MVIIEFVNIARFPGLNGSTADVAIKILMTVYASPVLHMAEADQTLMFCMTRGARRWGWLFPLRVVYRRLMASQASFVRSTLHESYLSSAIGDFGMTELAFLGNKGMGRREWPFAIRYSLVLERRRG